MRRRAAATHAHAANRPKVAQLARRRAAATNAHAVNWPKTALELRRRAAATNAYPAGPRQLWNCGAAQRRRMLTRPTGPRWPNWRGAAQRRRMLTRPTGPRWPSKPGAFIFVSMLGGAEGAPKARSALKIRIYKPILSLQVLDSMLYQGPDVKLGAC